MKKFKPSTEIVNQLSGRLWDQLWDQLRYQLGGQLGGQLRNRLWDQQLPNQEKLDKAWEKLNAEV